MAAALYCRKVVKAKQITNHTRQTTTWKDPYNLTYFFVVELLAETEGAAKIPVEVTVFFQDANPDKARVSNTTIFSNTTPAKQ